MIRQLLTAPNQLTLLRLLFVPFILIKILDGSYGWALGLLVAAGLSDVLDGQLARRLHQQTMLGQYLDPIADKLLLSSLFLVLSFVEQIPWTYTVLVFSRDICILLTAALLYMIVGLRDFRPSIFGKANTVAQVSTVFFVLLHAIDASAWIAFFRRAGLYATFVFTLLSGVHYVFLVEQRLRSLDSKGDSKIRKTSSSSARQEEIQKPRSSGTTRR
ncbi:MAG: CDP-alcohol phosphatidyltransferase family protein [Candidatus Korobacteraceae bacterium]